MKIISKYVVREHVGPFAFALTALTSLMLLNFIAKNLAHLVGKGLPPRVIGEFFALAVPFTVAMTLPMAVLVAVLYAFNRLAAENEVTAFKASGVSMQRLVAPSWAIGVVFSLVMLAFNDQILPRANQRLASLQRDILRASPTFALKEQVVNPIKEGMLYLKAGRISRGSANMRDVVVYDLSNPTRRRTIYADSGRIGIAPNQQDLHMTLYSGVMREVPTDAPNEVTQLRYVEDRIRVRNVQISFEESTHEEDIRSDREMSICEMQRRFEEADLRYQKARWEVRDAIADSLRRLGRPARDPGTFRHAPPRSLGAAYCGLQDQLQALARPKAAEAAVPAGARGWRIPADTGDTLKARLDSLRKDSLARAARDSVRADSIARFKADSVARAVAAAAAGTPPAGGPPVAPPGVATAAPGLPPALAPDSLPPGMAPPGAVLPPALDSAAIRPPGSVPPSAGMPAPGAWSRVKDAQEQVGLTQRSRNQYAVEIHKKFSLAAACVVFVLVGAPLALRFPRGGVGMVIGISLVIFAVSYVGLIGGEALADKGLLSPVWAMWAANLVLVALGLFLTARMGRENSAGRGGGIGEWWDGVRWRRARRRMASASPAHPAGA